MDTVEKRNEGRLAPPAALPVLPLLLADCIKAPLDSEGEKTVDPDESLLGNQEKPFFNVIAGF
jgi:hypothetical protein